MTFEFIIAVSHRATGPPAAGQLPAADGSPPEASFADRPLTTVRCRLQLLAEAAGPMLGSSAHPLLPPSALAHPASFQPPLPLRS